MPAKQRLGAFLRRARLFWLAEGVRSSWFRVLDRGPNRRFQEERPGEVFPPHDLAYDAYGRGDWKAYFEGGAVDAKFIASKLVSHCRKQDPRVLEWGCGPARILRHMRAALPGLQPSLSGSDYNARTIDWCRKAIRDASFELNGLDPPLPYPESSFDFLYNFSVFTHLSERAGLLWIKELARVLVPGGVLLLSTHGDRTTDRLLEKEKETYARGIVTRDGVPEGKRGFVTYHNPSYVRAVLLEGWELLEHVTDPPMAGFMQDIWIARKPGPTAGA
ncbi:class I SAM-dependent methyltransferase [bacterium]|nr:class I SAM-dependent methyltransferase [bacterium]